MNIIIFDFEVFRYDTLLGAIVVNNEAYDVVQLWNLDDIKSFYSLHESALWIGHNNDTYDNAIMNAILADKNVYTVSKHLISNGFRKKAIMSAVSYDLMCCKFYSLKHTEACAGKKIHTSDVDFDITRKLTDDEKKRIESYNMSDLLQTYENFKQLKDTLLLRLRLLKEFSIDTKYLTATEARLAALALSAKQIEGIEYMYVKPKLYDTLQIKNKDVIDFYLTEQFRHKKNMTTVICGLEHKLGAGGIHAAKRKCYEEKLLYLDVSGYYNLIMLNLDLLPRTIPETGKQLYRYMYEQQLSLKGVDDAKRWVYKTILLAVFGASMNQYTDFYDPQIGSLITITGQLYIVDLLEKLENKVELIQSNTDGLILKAADGYTDEDVLQIVNEWCDRTGFVIKPKYIYKMYQRDVNNYFYAKKEDIDYAKSVSIEEMFHNIAVKGECVGAYDKPLSMYTTFELWSLKEPMIIQHCVVNYFMYDMLPEETVKLCMSDMRYFQFICKKNSYDYCTLDTEMQDGSIESVRIPDLNRAFAKKGLPVSMIYKHSCKNGRHSKVKMPCLSDNVFIYNEEILSNDVVNSLIERIDFDYYISRAYERIREFIQIENVEDIV